MSEVESDDDLIRKMPHRAFDKLKANGYVLRHAWGGENNKYLTVRIMHGDRQIGKADFVDDGFASHCNHVTVEEDYRLKGVANAMYVFAEMAYGKWLWDFWKDVADSQSGDGRALWAQTNRPFGHPGKIAGHPRA